MKAKVTRAGFIHGRLVEPGEVIEVKQPASWYVPVDEPAPAARPAKPAKLPKETKADPVNPDDLA